MDRRLLVVPGALLVLLFVVDVSVVGWQASLRAGMPASPGSYAVVNASDLPARCADAAVTLADGNNVSIRGYRIASESVDLQIERTSVSERWALSDANCADRLAGLDNLRVDGQSYRVLGGYSRERLDRTPLFGLAKLGSGVGGVALLAAGLLATVHRESE